MGGFTYEQIGLGNAPNDGLGDPLRDGGTKINSNMTKIEKVLNNVENGKLQIWKHPDNNDPNMVNVIQAKDMIKGFFTANDFADPWQYVSGNIGEATSYTKLGGWEGLP